MPPATDGPKLAAFERPGPSTPGRSRPVACCCAGWRYKEVPSLPGANAGGTREIPDRAPHRPWRRRARPNGWLRNNSRGRAPGFRFPRRRRRGSIEGFRSDPVRRGGPWETWTSKSRCPRFAQALRRLQGSLQKRGGVPCLTRQSRSVRVTAFTVSGRPAERGPQGRRCESAATPSL